MTGKLEKPTDIMQEVWDAVDVPELSDEDFARAVPLRDAQPELFEAWKRRRGRPTINGRPKTYIGFRFAADLVEGLKATGSGYNGRVERLLREALDKGAL